MKKMTTITAAFACAVLGICAGPAAASARIDKGDAALAARLELSDYADYRCERRSDCDYATYPELTKYDCRWQRSGSVLCVGAVDLRLNTDAEDEILNTDYVTATVRVRRGSGALGLRAKVIRWEYD